MSKSFCRAILPKLLFGQFVAFATSFTGVFTTLLVQDNSSLPVLQSITAYVFVAMVFGALYLYYVVRHRRLVNARYASTAADVAVVLGDNYDRSNYSSNNSSNSSSSSTKKYPGVGKALWRFAAIGLVDLQANFVVVKAYAYTNLVSVQLLDCSSIVWVMGLSTALTFIYNRHQQRSSIPKDLQHQRQREEEDEDRSGSQSAAPAAGHCSTCYDACKLVNKQEQLQPQERMRRSKKGHVTRGNDNDYSEEFRNHGREKKEDDEGLVEEDTLQQNGKAAQRMPLLSTSNDKPTYANNKIGNTSTLQIEGDNREVGGACCSLMIVNASSSAAAHPSSSPPVAAASLSQTSTTPTTLPPAFQHHYKFFFHVVGVLVAVSGVVLLVILDADGQTHTGGPPGENVLLGDFLCILASFLYATSNVACEFLVKTSCSGGGGSSTQKEDRRIEEEEEEEETASHMRLRQGDHPTSRQQTNKPTLLLSLEWIVIIEYLFWMPLFGALFGLIQFFATGEYKLLPSASASASAFSAAFPTSNSNSSSAIPTGAFARAASGVSYVDVYYQIGFGASMLVVYALMPVLFFVASATFANLSLLTSDIFAIIWNVAFFGILPKWSFVICFCVIVFGVIVFDTNGFEDLRQKQRQRKEQKEKEEREESVERRKGEEDTDGGRQ